MEQKGRSRGLGQISCLLMPTSIYLLLSSDAGAPGPQACGLGQGIYTIRPDSCSSHPGSDPPHHSCSQFCPYTHSRDAGP